MREFRSALPSLLHKRGIDIIPVTLEVCIIHMPYSRVGHTSMLTVCNICISSILSCAIISHLQYCHRKSLCIAVWHCRITSSVNVKLTNPFKSN